MYFHAFFLLMEFTFIKKHILLPGELEESMAELEESRRKLINLKIEKHGFSRIHGSVLNVVNGDYSPNKPVEKTRGLQELKISIEEAKVA